MIPHLLEAWQVFLLYLIPGGGGIPAGLVLAQQKGVTWPESMVLYFISVVIKACWVEMVIILFVYFARHSRRIARFVAAMRESTRTMVERFGFQPSRLTLVMISFGVDPITGRSAALAAGHGFVSGWMLAIAGDMIFFSVIMISTYALNGILGNGTLSAVIVTIAIVFGPALFRRVRARFSRKPD